MVLEEEENEIRIGLGRSDHPWFYM